MILFLLRRPQFPFIIQIGDRLVAAKSAGKLDEELQRLGPVENDFHDAVDNSGEGWCLSTEHWVISPIWMRKKWTKAELIRAYNTSRCAEVTGKIYPEKSLSSKRFDRIHAEIAELIIEANRQERQT